tara:strand:+ start:962 stop:2482 length:1521 start_codon:yes stop_codon:yes gene_type:complete
MKTLRVILADQLSENISSLQNIDKANDTVLMMEVKAETKYVKHHKKKIAFLFSAMRHFAKNLTEQGINVRYIKLTDADNTGNFTDEIKRTVKDLAIDKVIITQPGEYRVLEILKDLQKTINLEILDDDRFLCSIDEFKDYAEDKKNLRMEFFYRIMRRKHNILIDDNNQPVGGKWNYDSENRKPASNDMFMPQPYEQKADDITAEVLKLVETEFADHFGDLYPFTFAVTRTQALACLDKFFAERFELFGDYQDAMVEGQAWMYHSHISFYLNCGLLDPLEVIKKAEELYYTKNIPLNAVEGFIRQILGWREYVRGIYWLRMPEFENENYLDANRDLPEFFWTGNSKMNCLKQCITETKENAYAHHIQRLMVIGNFSLITGLSVEQVNEWYLAVYADAYQWVELPNVSGMILFADGGYLGSKPYAAGGAYINKMSDYCVNCKYSIKEKTGDKACPFNYLYWNFLIQHKDKFEKNPRMAMIYRTLDKMKDENKENIIKSSQKFLVKFE